MTEQLPDIILLQGKRNMLLTNPLDSYWEITGKTKPKFKETISCRRGYVATWTIDGNDLLLTSIEGECQRFNFFIGKKWVKVQLSTIFPKSKGKHIKASWYTGKLRIPIGPIKEYAHRGYDSRFEKEKFISVNKGNITKVVTVDYAGQQLIINKPELK